MGKCCSGLLSYEEQAVFVLTLTLAFWICWRGYTASNGITSVKMKIRGADFLP